MAVPVPLDRPMPLDYGLASLAENIGRQRLRGRAIQAKNVPRSRLKAAEP